MTLTRKLAEAWTIASFFTVTSYVLAYIAGWIERSNVNWFEVFAVATSYACTWLCVRQTRWNYPIGTVSVMLYAVVFWQAGLVGSAFLQVYLIGQLVYGWFRWRSDAVPRPVGRVDWRWWPAYALTTAAVYAGAYLLVTTLGGHFALIDSLILIGTILAQFLLDNKKLETWFVWAVVNVAAIYVYFNAGLPLAGFQYCLFLVNTVVGFIMWRRSKDDYEWSQRKKRRRTTEEVFGPRQPKRDDLYENELPT